MSSSLTLGVGRGCDNPIVQMGKQVTWEQTLARVSQHDVELGSEWWQPA